MWWKDTVDLDEGGVPSPVPVMVDGHKVDKGKRVQLKPGAVLQAGDDVCFQVRRAGATVA